MSMPPGTNSVVNTGKTTIEIGIVEMLDNFREKRDVKLTVPFLRSPTERMPRNFGWPRTSIQSTYGIWCEFNGRALPVFVQQFID